MLHYAQIYDACPCNRGNIPGRAHYVAYGGFWAAFAG